MSFAEFNEALAWSEYMIRENQRFSVRVRDRGSILGSHIKNASRILSCHHPAINPLGVVSTIQSILWRSLHHPIDSPSGIFIRNDYINFVVLSLHNKSREFSSLYHSAFSDHSNPLEESALCRNPPYSESSSNATPYEISVSPSTSTGVSLSLGSSSDSFFLEI